MCVEKENVHRWLVFIIECTDYERDNFILLRCEMQNPVLPPSMTFG